METSLSGTCNIRHFKRSFHTKEISKPVACKTEANVLAMSGEGLYFSTSSVASELCFAAGRTSVSLRS